MSPPAWRRGTRSLGLVSLGRRGAEQSTGLLASLGAPSIPRCPSASLGRGGQADPTAQRARRGGWGEMSDGNVVGWREGVEARTHARAAREGWGRGRGSHTTYCERLKGTTVPKC